MALKGNLKLIQGFVKDKDNYPEEDIPMTIGRDRSNTIPIMSRKVSRKHAKVVAHNGVYTIIDLESKTGTFVNNKKVTESVLRRDDIVAIGAVKFKFVLEDPAAAKAPAKPAMRAASPMPPPPSKPLVIPPKPIIPPKPALLNKEEEQSSMHIPSFSAEELAPVGRMIGGIKLIAAVARGRRTIVYKGIQSAENRVVALKVLNPKVDENPDVVKWFIKGAQEAGSLHHEDIVPMLGGGRDDGTFYVFSAFMGQGDATRRFARVLKEGAATVKMALESLVHVTRALEYAQGKGLLHLGIRPTKILFDETKRGKLNGLGFENGLHAAGAERTPETMPYLAPEQLSGGELTAATDMYSLGATFYFMLTAREPVLNLRKRISSPKLINPAVPDSICRIIERVTAPAPEERYASYGQLLHDLRWALRGEMWPR